ncbi:uncharacterized protein [Musca autumnalis]|uniref:uncharacterized protein n=1 Tax=Musca autumnalis TaxID=221902 RepID=UPI003CE7CAE1
MMMNSRRGLQQHVAATAASTSDAAATTPTTSALLNESRQLLLKQQLKLQLNLNVSEMMDNLRRSVDNDYNNKQPQQQFDGDLNWNRNLSLTRVQKEVGQQHVSSRGVTAADRELRLTTTTSKAYNATANNAKARIAARHAIAADAGEQQGSDENGQNKLDTVTTVPQLQQKFNKFNIIADEITTATTTTDDAAAIVTSESAAAAAVTLATTTRSFTSADGVAVTTLMSSTSLSLSSSAAAVAARTTTTTAATTYTSLTQKQPLNTALAKFNRIIDNTVPVINNYQQQQQQSPLQVADSITRSQQQQLQQQHPHEQQQQQHHIVGMPILSDSLKRRLASHHYTDLVVNNSKINFSYDRTNVEATTTTATTNNTKTTTSQQPSQSLSRTTTTTTDSSSLISLESITTMPKKVLMEVEDDDGATSSDWKRNDVHYLLKQLNSFSDIEEIEIVDMKQKQRQQQQQKLIIREQQQQQREHQQQQQFMLSKAAVQSMTQSQAEIVASTSHHLVEAKNLTVALPPTPPEQYVTNASSNIIAQSHATCSSSTSHPPVSSLPQYISSYSAHFSELTQHSQSRVHGDHDSEHDIEQRHQQRHDDVCYDATTHHHMESKQHSSPPSSPAGPLVDSPTATSLVIYSPSSQSHKGIRRYASLNQQQQSQDYDDDDSQMHSHYHQRQHQCFHPQHHHHHHSHHHPFTQTSARLTHEHYSEGSILDSAVAARAAAACDPLALQQFVDDYIFQSCHYLETNNFAANYCTAMVESSSHEFRPSTTTTTRTSNEEYDDEECYVEDHSSAHSFELHECEPPTVICKAPAPLLGAETSLLAQPMRSSMRHLAPITTMPTAQATTAPPPALYTMETRLCSSGVQTDLTASSLAQSFSLSSSSSSSTEQRKRKQPIFKCCYTPLDRWREKRQQQQQIELKKRTKTVVSERQLTTNSHNTAITSSSHPGSKGLTATTTTTTTKSCLKNTRVSVLAGGGVGEGVLGSFNSMAGVSTSSSAAGVLNAITNTTTTTTTLSSSAAIVVHSQHHSLPTKNAPYAV